MRPGPLRMALAFAALGAPAACLSLIGANDVPDQVDAGPDAMIGTDASSDAEAGAGADGGPGDAGTDADARPSDAGDAGRGDAACDAGGCLPLYVQEVLADSPLAYWRLDEKDDAGIAADLLGTPPSGTYPGNYIGDVTWGQKGAIASDPSDTCVGLNLKGDQSGYVSVGGAFATLSEFTGQQPYSIEAWVQPSRVDGGYRGVITNELLGGGGKQGYALYLGGFTSNGFGIGYDRYDDGSSTPVRDAGAVTSGAGWFHVVGVYGSGEITIYVNGGVAAQSPTSLSIQPFTKCSFDIGSSLCGMSGFYEGLIDEVAVYGTALDAGRVQAHYRAAQAQ